MAEGLNDLNGFQRICETDREHEERSARADDFFYPRESLDEIIAKRGRPLLTCEQIVQKWAGVFPPEYWDTVLRIVDER